jgi:NADH dehydrogenase
MTNRLAAVFGGAGFIGRYVVQRLAQDGWRVRVVGRHREEGAFLRPRGDVGQVVLAYADITRDYAVQAAVARADLVVNLVGVLNQRGRDRFSTINVKGAGQLAEAAQAAGVAQFVHVSALGADHHSPSLYGQSKAEGEDLVRKAFPRAAILRPSVVFGPEDHVFNRIAALAGWTPVMPVVAANTRLQPVYVGDVAAAVVAAATAAHEGTIFELGGPKIYTMRQIVELALAAAGRRRLLLPLPTAVAAIKAAVLQFLPDPLLTPDQLKMLSVDNVVGGALPGFARLGIDPQPAEAIVPTYLAV